MVYQEDDENEHGPSQLGAMHNAGDPVRDEPEPIMHIAATQHVEKKGVKPDIKQFQPKKRP